LLQGVAENPTFPILRALAYTTGLGCKTVVLHSTESTSVAVTCLQCGTSWKTISLESQWSGIVFHRTSWQSYH